MITRQIVADKITDYLHGRLSQEELVDWAEHAMMDTDFDKADTDLLTDIVGRLGLADVAAVKQPETRPGFQFGLRWQDCEEPSQRKAVRDGRSRAAVSCRAAANQFLRRLGYRAKVIVSAD